MKNKMVIIILGILFIIFLSLGLIGLFNKDKVNVKPEPTPLKNNVQTMELTSREMQVIGLNDKLSSFELVKANKGFESGYLKLTINNNEIKVDVQKNGIKNATDSTPDVVTYTIKDIDSPVAVQAQMSSDGANEINVYTLDAFGRLFSSSFNADPASFENIKTTYYKVDNIESFVSLTIPLIGEANTNPNYVVFKTKDGTYYTDYIFNLEIGKELVKIINIESEVVEK